MSDKKYDNTYSFEEIAQEEEIIVLCKLVTNEDSTYFVSNYMKSALGKYGITFQEVSADNGYFE